MQKRRKAEGNSFIRVPGGGGERPRQATVWGWEERSQGLVR